jgi:hypothetical protein
MNCFYTLVLELSTYSFRHPTKISLKFHLIPGHIITNKSIIMLTQLSSSAPPTPVQINGEEIKLIFKPFL